VSGLEVADTVLAALDKPAALKQPVRDRPGHDRRYALDTSRMRSLGWEPRVGFADGIRRTVDWYLANPSWWRPLKSGEFWEFYRRNYRRVTE